ncbi:MAG TPA: peptidoglycan-binding domain-containing protein [Caulobacteraceae bacterium]|jgi:hypothetical protein|nr:peptidoglycan-binding domain-containing protein [Caulobacteraceae bacterium]
MSRLRLAFALTAAGLSCLAGALSLSSAQARDLPPPANARPGECYGKVMLPAAYRSSRRQVLVRGPWTETRRAAAVVKRTPRRVLVRPEVIERIHTAPVYRTEVAWVEHPGQVRHVVEPARYEIVRETVQVEAAHAEWRRTSAPLAYGETASGQTMLQPTGEVVCRVWVPARYETVERRVKVAGGRSYDLVGPARQEKVVRRVLVSRGGWIERRRPAVYRTTYVERVVRPGGDEVVRHPATYRTVETRTLIRPARQGWSRVVCGERTDRAFIQRMQQALIARGFDPGPADGAGRPTTYSALRAFQHQHGLAEGQMTPETAAALGLN